LVHPNTPAPPSDNREEITSTLSELVAAFGSSAVASAASEIGLFSATAVTSDIHQQALRRYTLMLIDAKHPRQIAQMVARLTYLDTAHGSEITQEQIGRAMGVTKAAVSNAEADIAQKLGLPRRSSPHARDSHRRMNKRNYSFIAPQP
jgi:hypothetical protein